MRPIIAIAAGAVALCAAGSAAAATLEIRDAVARVTVVPEDRSDIRVDVVSRNPRLPIEITSRGADVVVDGGLRHRIMSCHGARDRARAWVSGVGDIGPEAMPQLVVHTPRAISVSSSGAVVGTVGRADSLDLHDSGCSAWTIADVRGGAVLEESGKGSIRMGSAGRLEVHLSGAANVHAVRVREAMNAQLSGVGGLQVEDLGGSMEAQVSGIGHVKVAGGRASNVRAQVSGMGGVDFGGSAQSLEAAISGIGSVHVRQVTGPVSQSVSGAGHVTIDQRS